MTREAFDRIMKEYNENKFVDNQILEAEAENAAENSIEEDFDYKAAFEEYAKNNKLGST